MNYRPQRFSILPPVIKNLLIINGIFFLATWVLQGSFGIDLVDLFGLHYPASTYFEPYQIVTHMFMHANLTHIFFNMFALWMFGTQLENLWGPKRFLIFYMVSALGAAILHEAVIWYQISELTANMNPADIRAVFDLTTTTGSNQMAELYRLAHTPVVGASGAVFGILLGFGMMFPNSPIYIYFLFPIKAKYFVMIYGALELWSGISNAASPIAHFAHLGGMLFGYLLLRYWQLKRPY